MANTSNVHDKKVGTDANNALYSHFYSVTTPKNYPDDGTCFEVVWNSIFMPFSVAKGIDNVPPDNEDYTKHKKNHWWVYPKQKKDIVNIHSVEMFIIELRAFTPKEFTSLEKAIKFCMEWRKKWLMKEITKTSKKIFTYDTNA